MKDSWNSNPHTGSRYGLELSPDDSPSIDLITNLYQDMGGYVFSNPEEEAEERLMLGLSNPNPHREEPAQKTRDDEEILSVLELIVERVAERDDHAEVVGVINRLLAGM